MFAQYRALKHAGSRPAIYRVTAEPEDVVYYRELSGPEQPDEWVVLLPDDVDAVRVE